jgi:hypothetical protein
MGLGNPSNLRSMIIGKSVLVGFSAIFAADITITRPIVSIALHC